MNRVQIELQKMDRVVKKIAHKYGLKDIHVNITCESFYTQCRAYINVPKHDAYIFTGFKKHPTMKQFKQQVNIAVAELAAQVKELEANTEG